MLFERVPNRHLCWLRQYFPFIAVMRFNIFPEITSEKCAWILNTCDPNIRRKRLFKTHTHGHRYTGAHAWACTRVQASGVHPTKQWVHRPLRGFQEGLSFPARGTFACGTRPRSTPRVPWEPDDTDGLARCEECPSPRADDEEDVVSAASSTGPLPTAGQTRRRERLLEECDREPSAKRSLAPGNLWSWNRARRP